jgi:PAS domain S-box-containing protein
MTADAQIKKDGKKSSERSIEKIRQQEALLREAEKIGHMGSWQRNLETGELTWSDELYRIYGLKHGENVITTKYFLEKVVHPEDRLLVKKHIHDMYKKQIEYAMEYRIMTKEGPKIVYSKPKITFSPDKKKVIDIRGIVRDITAQKKAEEQILILKLSQQKEILNTILHVQEAERSRIGESLHNGIGQLLYAIKLKHESLGSKIPEHKNTLSEINNLLAEAITETRNISFELVPNLLKDFGLNMALKELCKTGMRHACEIKYTPAELKDRLPQQLEMAIFRIVQEIINNIIKHAKATKAAVSMKITKKEIIVKVNDNGVGFNTRKTFSSGSGFGLRNIKSRVQLFNGELDITSKKGKGTSVTMKFPVN